MRQFEPQPDPDTLYCEDPCHPEDCTCGADPDYEYDRKRELRE